MLSSSTAGAVITTCDFKLSIKSILFYNYLVHIITKLLTDTTGCINIIWNTIPAKHLSICLLVTLSFLTKPVQAIYCCGYFTFSLSFKKNKNSDILHLMYALDHSTGWKIIWTYKPIIKINNHFKPWFPQYVITNIRDLHRPNQNGEY